MRRALRRRGVLLRRRRVRQRDLRAFLRAVVSDALSFSLPGVVLFSLSFAVGIAVSYLYTHVVPVVVTRALYASAVGVPAYFAFVLLVSAVVEAVYPRNVSDDFAYEVAGSP